MIFGYYKNCLYTHRYKFSSKKKKKEFQYMVSHPETDSDSPIGSDQESGHDNKGIPGYSGYDFSGVFLVCKQGPILQIRGE